MRAFILSAALVVALPAAAFAGSDDVMTNYFGNTVVSKNTMSEAHIHYKPDHTFDGNATSMMGAMDLKGTWKIDDKGQLCRTYDTPPPGVTNPLCTPISAHKVGDSWTMMDRTITLVQGIQ
jgi:hypothetical protein